MLMKIKIFGSKNINELERMVNEFCEKHTVVDMQHTTLVVNSCVTDRVFVMYNDRQEVSTDPNCTNCKYAPVPFCNEPCNTCSPSTFNHWEANE